MRQIVQQQCQHNSKQIVAYDLDQLVQPKDRYLCMECLAKLAPYRQTMIAEKAQQKFKEMISSGFENKKQSISSYISKLQTLKIKIEQAQEFFKSKLIESIEILNQQIQEVQNQQNTLIEPSYEMQTEQDLINLSNYVNYGFNQNPNQETNPKNYEFLDQIKQQLDYSKFEENLKGIFNQLELIYTQTLIEKQVKIIPFNQLQIDFTKQISLRYQCPIHQSEIIMICLQPGQINHRFFCQNCILENNQQELKTIQDVNQQWQSHTQSIQLSNQNFNKLRQNYQDEIYKLIQEYQKFNSISFNQIYIEIINQNNKILEKRNDQSSSNWNKQLFQMDLKQIQVIVQTLSQHEPMQEVRQQQFEIQEEDKKYKDQILEQLNLQSKKIMEIQSKINQLFCFDLPNNEVKDDQMEQYFSQKLFPQFCENYKKFLNQYKKIIDYVDSKLKTQIQINSQQSNHQNENQIQQCKQILEQILAKQVSLTTQYPHDQLKLQIKSSQNNLTTQNLHIQEKYLIKRNLQLTINKISDYSDIQYNQWFKYFKKENKFSDQQKHQTLKLYGSHKVASINNNNYTYATCLCDQPIPQVGSFNIDFKINKLYCTMIGICKSKFIKQNFNFDNKEKNQHGFYILGYDGNVYSHHDSQKNNKQLGFRFNEGDIINVKVNQQIKQIIWRNKAEELSCSLEFQHSDDLYFCCVLYSSGNEVEII